MSDLVAELNKVKKDIRSLLISAPNGLTPKMLEKDYSAVMGQALPYRKFGYLDATDFLRSLSDILRITYQHNQILLFGIADKSTEHILKMVKKQKKPKFYNSITSTQQQPTSSKKKLQPSSNFPSAFTRAGVLKVLKKYPNGISVMKLPDYYRELNGTRLDVQNTKDIPSMILNMSDIASLDYGRREQSGNNLYIFPSKTLIGYQKSLDSNTRTNSQPPKLNRPPALSSVSKVATTSSTTSTTVQSWVNSLSSCATITSTSTCTTSTSMLSHFNAKTTVNQNVPKLTTIGPQRFAKLSSTTSSGIMSRESCSASSPSDSSTSPCKSVVARNDDDFDETLRFEDSTPPASILLKQEIVELLRECRTEIRSIKLSSLYKKKYNKELNLHKHGYYSIVELIATMTDQINMCRASRSGDWVLKLRRSKSEKASRSSKDKSIDKAAKLGNLEREVKELLRKYRGGIAVDSLEDLYEMHFEHHLPLEDFGVNSACELICKITDTIILKEDQLCMQSASACDSFKKNEPATICAPLDAVGFGIRYKPPFLPSMDWGFFDCFVTYVNNPSDFRIQIIGEDTTEAFNILMDDIERTYCHTDARAYRIPPHMIVQGQICVAIYHGDNNWNRAVIEQKPSGGFVKVRYVDYGDIASVSTGAVYYLKRKYFELPILEVHARLANIRPARSNQWEIGAKKALLDFSKNKPLVARVTGEEERGGIKVFALELCDVSTGDDLYINDVLLEKRLASLVENMDDDLTPAEIQHIIDNSAAATTKDIPADSPPPYQVTEPIPPLIVNSSQAVSAAPASTQLPDMPPLSVPAPPPGFGNVMPQKEASALAISRLLETLSGKKENKTVNVATCSKKATEATNEKEQKKFLKPFRLTDNLTVHVINFKGTALLLSGEISRIFRPDEDDMLAPLLMMKGIHNLFPELLLANNKENEKLFSDFEKYKITDAFRHGVLRPVITLHRLTDVPDMIFELDYDDKTALNQRFAEIISYFDPDSPYWFRDSTSPLGAKLEGSSSESSSTYSNSVSEYSTTGIPPPGLIKICGAGDVTSFSSERNDQLNNQKKDALFHEVMSSNHPSFRAFNELKSVTMNADEKVKGVFCSGDGPSTASAEESLNMCVIPSDDNAPVQSVFSEIRQSCDGLLNPSSESENELYTDQHCEDQNTALKVAVTEESVLPVEDFVSVTNLVTSAVGTSTVSLPDFSLSVVPSCADVVLPNSTLSVTNAVAFVPSAWSVSRTPISSSLQAADTNYQQVSSIIPQGVTFSPPCVIGNAYPPANAAFGYTMQSAQQTLFHPQNVAAWPTSLSILRQQNVIFQQQPEIGRGVFPF